MRGHLTGGLAGRGPGPGGQGDFSKFSRDLQESYCGVLAAGRLGRSPGVEVAGEDGASERGRGGQTLGCPRAQSQGKPSPEQVLPGRAREAAKRYLGG